MSLTLTAVFTGQPTETVTGHRSPPVTNGGNRRCNCERDLINKWRFMFSKPVLHLSKRLFGFTVCIECMIVSLCKFHSVWFAMWYLLFPVRGAHIYSLEVWFIQCRSLARRETYVSYYDYWCALSTAHIDWFLVRSMCCKLVEVVAIFHLMSWELTLSRFVTTFGASSEWVSSCRCWRSADGWS